MCHGGILITHCLLGWHRWHHGTLPELFRCGFVFAVASVALELFLDNRISSISIFKPSYDECDESQLTGGLHHPDWVEWWLTFIQHAQCPMLLFFLCVKLGFIESNCVWGITLNCPWGPKAKYVTRLEKLHYDIDVIFSYSIHSETHLLHEEFRWSHPKLDAILASSIRKCPSNPKR